MKVFDAYAGYYNLLYKDKNYNSEAEYIDKLIKKYKPGARKILDLGCGTGKHDFIFAEKGYDVTGVELSEKMLRSAEENLKSHSSVPEKLKFIQGDIKEVRSSEKFDVIVSLFHVMSYQTKNEDVQQTLETVREHLDKDGIFIFDFWYGPAVLTVKPEPRVKNLESENLFVERFAEPVLKINENVVDVNYKVKIMQKPEGPDNVINETHSMRYFFIPEMSLFLNHAGMRIKHYEEWMTSEELSEKSWSALIVAGNIKKNIWME